MTQAIHPIEANIFAGGTHDRVDALRKDQAWVAAQLDSPGTLFVPVWRARNLITAGSEPSPGFLSSDVAAPFLARVPWALLGVRDGNALFALDFSSLDDPPAGLGGAYEDLRRLGTLLSGADAALLAHARGLMHWRNRHRYCGVCGAACLAQDAGHVMRCTGCGAQHFPRTDPAVIMLVTDGDRALLGEPAHFAGFFTTLAGFVEPGESLEEAVAREVHEEAGIRVANVRYHSSQPWPFPASIMLGFSAEALTTDINFDPNELRACAWFTRAQLRAPEGFSLPPRLSIARRLIEDWLGAL